jgi:WD40 repeat protein
MALLLALAQDQPVPPHALNPAIPTALSDLVMRLLSKDPAGRPQSAAAVVAAIDRIERAQGAPPTAASRRSRRWPVALALAAALLLIGILLGQTTVTLQTKDGTLVVTTTEPGVKIFVDGEEKIVIDSKRAGKVIIAPGKHQLVVKRGDEELFTTAFSLKSGGEEIIHATWEPRGGGPKPPDKGSGQKNPEAVPPVSGASPLDHFDPKTIPPEDRFDWQPKKLVAVIGEHRQRFAAEVICVAWSGDGKWIAAVVKSDAEPLLYEASTMRRVALLPLGLKGLRMVAFSPDGKTLACACLDKTVRLLDVSGVRPEGKTPAKLKQRVLQGGGNTVAFSPDGKLLASRLGGTIHLWDATRAEPQELAVFQAAAEPLSDGLAFGNNSKLLAVPGRGKDPAVQIWDLTDPRQPVEKTVIAHVGGKHALISLAFGPGDKTLWATTHEGSLLHCDLTAPDAKKGSMLQVISHAGRCVAVAPDGKTLLNFDSSMLPVCCLWDITGKPTEKAVYKGRKYYFDSLAFAPDGQAVVTGSAHGSVRVWDLKGWELQERRPLTGAPSEVRSVAFTPGDQRLLTASYLDALRVWDLSAIPPREEQVHPWQNLVGARLAPDGKTVAILTDQYNSGVLWQDFIGPTPKELAKLPVATVVAFASGDALLHSSAARPSPLTVLTLGGPKPAARVLATAGTKGSLFWSFVAASPDGRWAASREGNFPDALEVWDLLADQPKRQPLVSKVGPVQSAVFSPNGKVLVAGGVAGPQIWKLAGPKWQEFAVLTAPGNWTKGAEFSPDGRRFAAIDHSGILCVWDAATWDELYRWTLPMARSLAFAGDGRHLALGNSNGTVYVLRLSAG